MSDTPAIPTLQSYPVSGDPEGISVQSGHYLSGSQVLAAHGADISGTAASLSGGWRGAAASSYQSFSRDVSGAFLETAATLEGVATRLARYASELAGLQSQARQAADESRHWHDQITLWTQRLIETKAAVTRAQGQLDGAERAASAAVAAGHPGVTGIAVASAQTALTTAQHDVTVASRQVTQAHQEFAQAQRRGQLIQTDAHQLGADVSVALIGITITAPPIALPPAGEATDPEPPLTIPPITGTPPYPELSPRPPVPLPAKKGKGGENGKGGTGQPEREGGSRGRPHRPSGTGKSGWNKHSKARAGNAGKRPPFRVRPKNHRGPWPPKLTD